jgi:hypothetical protein
MVKRADPVLVISTLASPVTDRAMVAGAPTMASFSPPLAASLA